MKKLLLCFIAMLMSIATLNLDYFIFAQSTLYLSDLSWMTQQCGAPSDFPQGTQKDMAVDGNEMVLRKDGASYTFTKGLGAHAPSQITYDITNLNASHFYAYAGVDVRTTNDFLNGKEGIIANFKVLADGQVLAESGEMNPTKDAYYFDVEIPTNTNELTLVAEQGTNNYSDWIIWGDAKLEVDATSPRPEDYKVTSEMVYGNEISLKVEEGVLQFYRMVNAEPQLIAKTASLGSVKVNQKLVNDFKISKVEITHQIATVLGQVNRMEIWMNSNKSKLQKKVVYDLSLKVDGGIYASSYYYFDQIATLSEIKEHEIILVEPNPNQIWSYNGGGEGAQSYYDTIQKVSNSFYRANKQDDTAVGIPVADIYADKGGVTIGDASLYRKFLTTPVKGGNQSATVSMIWEEESLIANTWQNIGNTIIAIHENDYYNGLKTYGDMMELQGFVEPSYIPTSSYDLRWESWGWEGAWTIDKILAKLDELYAHGIRQITLDDCWYTSAGDWELNPDKFPNGIEDMKRLTDTIHQKGMTIVLWWRPMDGGRNSVFSVLAGFSQQPSKLLEEHPEYFVKNEDGSFAKLSGPGASNAFNGSTGYALCPYSEGAVQSQVEFIRRAMNDWGIDGFKSDYVWGMPQCYNAQHNHTSSKESTQYASNIFYQAIYEEIIKNNPEGFHLLCNCGTPQDYYSFPYVTQIPTADPTSVSQTRRRVKAYKALTNDNFPVTTDHNELWYPSTIGTGGLLIEKRDFSNQSQENEYYKWLDIANEHQLHKGTHIGNLYAYGIDPYETYVVKKDDMMYYAFYNDGIYKTSGTPQVILKGLDPDKYYRIEDYVNNKVIVDVISGKDAMIQPQISDYLLIRAVETNEPEMTLVPLQEKIAEAKAISASIYTKDSYETLKNAIEKAMVALDQVQSYSEMLNAVNDLQAAINQLEVKPLDDNYLINKDANSAVHVESCDSQYTGETADKTLDHNNNTIWHSDWSESDKLPISVTYDLGATYSLSDLTFLGRQNGSINGDIFEFDLYVGDDANNLTFVKHVVMDTVGSGTTEKLANRSGFQRVMFEATGRYVKMTVTRSGSDNAAKANYFASMAEIRFYEAQEIIPSKVENVKTEDTNYKTITLTWDASENATAYDVYRKAYDSEEFKLYKTVTDTTLKVSGVMTGKEYAFYVVAKNEVGAAEASATVVKATTLHGKVTLDIDQVSTSTFKLSWNKISGATRYIVYRKRNGDKMKKVLTLGAKDLTYTTAELPNGDYQFILKAGRYDSKDRVMTKASNTVAGSVKKVAPAVTLKAVTKAIKVSWKKVEGVTHYQVYRATSFEGKYTKLTTTKELSYTAKSLKSGKKYFFKVRGYKLYKSGEDIKYAVYTPYSTIKYATAK